MTTLPVNKTNESLDQMALNIGMISTPDAPKIAIPVVKPKIDLKIDSDLVIMQQPKETLKIDNFEVKVPQGLSESEKNRLVEFTKEKLENKRVEAQIDKLGTGLDEFTNIKVTPEAKKLVLSSFGLLWSTSTAITSVIGIVLSIVLTIASFLIGIINIYNWIILTIIAIIMIIFFSVIFIIILAYLGGGILSMFIMLRDTESRMRYSDTITMLVLMVGTIIRGWSYAFARMGGKSFDEYYKDYLEVGIGDAAKLLPKLPGEDKK